MEFLQSIPVIPIHLAPQFFVRSLKARVVRKSSVNVAKTSAAI